MSFGLNVKRLMDREAYITGEKFTQQMLADRTSISSRAKISNWKNIPGYKINPGDVRKVADYFGYTEEELTQTTIVIPPTPRKLKGRILDVANND